MEADKSRLERILELGVQLNSIQDLDILLERILLIARETVNADAGSIYIKEADNTIEIKYTQNRSLERKLGENEKMPFANVKLSINTSTVAGWVATTKQIAIIDDMYKIAPSEPFIFNPKFDQISGYKTVSSITLPLLTNDQQLLGVLQLINSMDSDANIIAFSTTDVPLLEHLASIATIALQRAMITRSILLRMISMASLRDPKETAMHVNRVGSFAVALYEVWAKRRNISDYDIRKFSDILRMSAMLHDVGKVGISDSILKKPARFTEKEFRIMQYHTLIGANLFKNENSELDLITHDVALRHHENWDGSGYPGKLNESGNDFLYDENDQIQGLKGEEIPLVARIVSLVDMFDALASQRVYKKSWADEDVLAEIRACSGIKFDPELVELFFEILPSIKQIRLRFQDK